ncbi:PH domain-containing protein [Streptacidiphilus sp. ASG 303]|uniref:PH domain-containing protein n=1 Tax=Streptacidiphilus sp. ASG 303 TaxID=2896847 RepID=UPI001E29E99D|nr:PH domain-containing protein [Streptacidiphilus sp. ASG 303]MCD0481611.1 PH domain-containing protein [Streptacidiphilus sp. ASG 303]
MRPGVPTAPRPTAPRPTAARPTAARPTAAPVRLRYRADARSRALSLLAGGLVALMATPSLVDALTQDPWSYSAAYRLGEALAAAPFLILAAYLAGGALVHTTADAEGISYGRPMRRRRSWRWAEIASVDAASAVHRHGGYWNLRITTADGTAVVLPAPLAHARRGAGPVLEAADALRALRSAAVERDRTDA